MLIFRRCRQCTKHLVERGEKCPVCRADFTVKRFYGPDDTASEGGGDGENGIEEIMAYQNFAADDGIAAVEIPEQPPAAAAPAESAPIRQIAAPPVTPAPGPAAASTAVVPATAPTRAIQRWETDWCAFCCVMIGWTVIVMVVFGFQYTACLIYWVGMFGDDVNISNKVLVILNCVALLELPVLLYE